MDKNDIITLKLCKRIELIKCNVCAKYEPSAKWNMPGIKEKIIMTSALQGPFEPDSQNTDKLKKSFELTFLRLTRHNKIS